MNERYSQIGGYVCLNSGFNFNDNNGNLDSKITVSAYSIMYKILLSHHFSMNYYQGVSTDKFKIKNVSTKIQAFEHIRLNL